MGIKEKIKIIENAKMVHKENISSDYMCGYYNGIEFCLSILNNHEPEYMAQVIEEVEEQEVGQSRTGIFGKRFVGG